MVQAFSAAVRMAWLAALVVAAPAAGTPQSLGRATPAASEAASASGTPAAHGATAPILAHGARLNPDERVVLYPALAHSTRRGWIVEAEGMVFEPSSTPSTLLLLGGWLGLQPDSMTADQRRRLQQRLEPFFVDHERGKRLSFPVPGRTREVRAERSGADGRFRLRWEIPRSAAPPAWNAEGGVWTGTIAFPFEGRDHPRQQEVPWTIHAIGPEGWSVVSDIDDTIKVSHVLDRSALIRKTFLEDFEAVPGMADRYRDWARAGARFHYVSASPWQLHEALESFRAQAGFPAGTFHLKRLRPAEAASVAALFGDQRHHKRAILDDLLSRFPRRRFLLVGDSGEQDPEIYGDVARRHPGRIHGIAIRKVTPEDAGHARYQAAFQGLPKGDWRLFDEAGELSGWSVPGKSP